MAGLRSFFEVFFGPLDALLAAVPLELARYCAVVLLVVPVLLALRQPRQAVYRGAPDTRPWRDLRLWAVVVTLPYALIYLLG